MTTHSLACSDGRRRARDRRAVDCLTADEVNRVILNAIDAGNGSVESIRDALRQAREAAAGDGIRLNERGEATNWAH
jgi:hypothetical protein